MLFICTLLKSFFFVFIKGLQFFFFKYCYQCFIIVRARSLPSFYPGHQRPTCPHYLQPPQGLPAAPPRKGSTPPPFSNARTTGAPALGTMIGLKKKKKSREWGWAVQSARVQCVSVCQLTRVRRNGLSAPGRAQPRDPEQQLARTRAPRGLQLQVREKKGKTRVLVVGE